MQNLSSPYSRKKGFPRGITEEQSSPASTTASCPAIFYPFLTSQRRREICHNIFYHTARSIRQLSSHRDNICQNKHYIHHMKDPTYSRIARLTEISTTRG